MKRGWSLFLTFALILGLSSFIISCGYGGDDDDDTSDDDATDDDTDDDITDDDTDDDIDGCVEGEFYPYWGVLHCHTSYSDGEQTPAYAFAYARDVAQLDMLVVTDHLEQLYLPFPVADKWGKCHEQADEAYAPGEFLADCGFEYGSGFILPWFWSTGHNNVFFSDYLFPMIQLDFHDFYQTLVDCSTCIGQFNHPGDEEHQNWNNFEYFADVDKKMNLFEFNGGGPVWDMFFQALDMGWHVSPMYNQDNHDADWGTKNDRRSGFYLADLTREDLYNAMKDRRSFMSYDKNASVKLMAKLADDKKCWMGSIIKNYPFQTITLEVEAFDLDAGDGFTAIELYGPGKTLLDSFECGNAENCYASFEANVSGPTYFVVKANQADGNWLVAAPIWVEP